MTTMKPKEWDLSGLKAIESNDIVWDEGLQHVKILEVVYNDEFSSEKFGNTYTIIMQALEGSKSGEAITRLMYFLKTKDGLNNRSSVGSLNSLWNAIYGKTDTTGIPHPSDAEGCVVQADVTYGETAYVRCYKFEPASFKFAMHSDKMETQYFVEEE